MSFQGKHIVLGVTGSIAAYKSAALTRLLVKKGAEVQIVITPAGKEFITPVTLSALSGRPVVSEFFASGSGSWHSHVELGLWADLMIVAPATASTIGKMANGIADNMLVTTYLSMKAPVFVAPAMDLDMYRHISTRRNIETLKSDGVRVIRAAEGELASHLRGEGRMEEPENIVTILERFFASGNDLGKKKIVITAGPTYERIDPVRFIGNFSSGKMGFALAQECASRGAEVILLTGPTAQSVAHPNIRRINVESAAEMHAAALTIFPQTDAAILAAAVADYRPEKVSEKKIKRAGKEAFALSLVPNPDIAAALGKIKKPEQLTVGFALETNDEEANAIKKMEEKNLDCIVLNSLNDKGAGFEHDTNKITLLSRNGEKQSFPLQSKSDVAKDIIDTILKQNKLK
jgi:phosphopantothenoylcysteine decarboxylase/phosphopantothenate--cysteine ligase